MDEEFALVDETGKVIRTLKKEEIYNLKFRKSPIYSLWCRFCDGYLGFVQTKKEAKKCVTICPRCYYSAEMLLLNSKEQHPLYTLRERYNNLLIKSKKEYEYMGQKIIVPYTKIIKGEDIEGKSKEILDQLYFE